MNAMAFSPLNYTVLGVYLAAMLAIGWLYARRQKDGEDYYLAGRNLPWLAVAMSLYASVTSAMTYMGLPGMAFSQNASLLLVALMSPVVAPLLIRLYYPVYRRMRLTTSYEYIAHRFGPGARRAVAILFILARLGWLGTVIYAPALALSVVSGLPLWASILLMGVLATAYTVMGGLAAVVWTDVVQFVIMIGGAVWLAVALVQQAPDGFSGILAAAQTSGRLNFDDWSLNPMVMNSLGVVIAYFFILQQDYGVDQVSVQRLLAVRDDRGVTLAILFNALTDLLMIGLLLFIGLGLWAFAGNHPGFFPSGAVGDRVLPYFIIHALPDGVSGLLVTAIFAAAMSSMDSGINSLATVILIDLIKPLRSAPLTGAREVRAARGLTLILGIFSTAIAFGVVKIGGILKAFYTFMGLFSAPVLALFVLGLLTRHTRFWPWLIGTVTAIGLTLWAQQVEAMHEIYFFPFAFCVTFVAAYGLSLIHRPSSDGPADASAFGPQSRAAASRSASETTPS
jgi:SSS family transporter